MKRQFLAFSLLASTALGTMGGFSPAQADIIFDREANNTDSTAQVLPIMGAANTLFTEHVVKGSASIFVDPDVYRVRVDKSHLLTLTATTSSGSRIIADLYYDANLNGRAEASEFVETARSDIFPRTLEGMPGGTYFLQVRASSKSPSPYDLTWRTTTVAPRQVEVEPNNQSFRGTVVKGCFVDRRELQGSVNSNFDGLDYYRFTVCAPRTVTVSLGNFGNGGHLNLYHNKNGDGRIDSGEFLENKSGGSTIRMTRFLQAGEYFLEVVKPFGSGSANYLLNLIED